MLSICIVNWNTRELLAECLKAISCYPPSEEHEVIVVDNASPDGSAQMVKEEFPQVRLQVNAENVFYAAGNNQALQMARGDLVMLLNPDTEVKEGCLTRLAEFLRARPEAAAAAPRLLWPDGKPQSSCRSFPTPRALLLDMFGLGRLFPNCRVCSEYRQTSFPLDQLRMVDQPMASALMLRREALDQVGGFDEGFPMFFNDVDLCLRLAQAGWKTYFVPAAEALHHHGASTVQRRREMIAHSHDALPRFYAKHYYGRVGWLGYWTVLLMNAVGKQARLLAPPKNRRDGAARQLRPKAAAKAQEKRLIIAIDGPAAGGKSTLAKLLARRLGYLHLDTGAMYRAVGWKAQQEKIPLDDAEKVTELARKMEIRLRVDQHGENRVFADGQDITLEIRSSEAGEWASQVSALPGVRRVLVSQQRKLGAGGGIVAEGRDMQTVVFPRAEVKIFITASVRERARRRYAELKAKGTPADLDEIEQEMQKRDERDSTRADSPMRSAPEAIIVDTDGKTVEEVLNELLAIVHLASGASTER